MTQSLAGAKFALGVGAILFQYSLMIAGALIGLLVIALVLHKLDIAL